MKTILKQVYLVSVRHYFEHFLFPMRLSLILYCLVILFVGCDQQVSLNEPILLTHNPFSQINEVEAKKILNSLTLEQKIGQLIIYANTINDNCTQDSLDIWVENDFVGGIMLKNLTLECYKGKIDTLQNLASMPLLVGTDQLVSQTNLFSNTTNFPNLATMGSVPQDSFHRQMSDLHLRQTKSLGINFCLGPSININSNTTNQYDFNVAKNNWTNIKKNSTQFVRTMQTNEILSIARHISDIDNPVIKDSMWVLSEKLKFEKELSQMGISGFMIDPQLIQKNLSNPKKNYIRSFIQKQLGFQGLIFAQTNDNISFEDCFNTGADLIFTNKSPRDIIQFIKNQIEVQILSVSDINQRALKVIKAKQWLGFDYNRPPLIDTLSAYVYNNHEKLKYFSKKLFQNSVSIPSNPNCILPLNDGHARKIKWVKFGHGKMDEFQKQISYYCGNKINPTVSNETLVTFKKKYHRSFTTIITINQLNISTEKDSIFIREVNELSKKTAIIIVNFGNPNNLLKFDTSSCSMIHVFETNNWTEAFTAQSIFGGLAPVGIPPFEFQKCKRKFPKTRIAYTDPEDVNIDTKRLYDIRAYVNRGIRSRAFPGCQILVAKSGNVIYNKSFGHHTYNKKKAIKNTDLFDIASLTKTTATTVALMKMVDQKKVVLDNKLKDFFTIENNWKFSNITVKKLLLHQSGLQPNMPIGAYLSKRNNDPRSCNRYLCTAKTDSFNVQIANNVWFKGSLQDEIWGKMIKLKPKKRVRYRYSDVNFVLLQKIIEKQSKVGLDKYCNQNFFNPLRMTHCLYKPLSVYQKSEIVPTANDQRWRKQLIQGFVHDESAALLNGIAGNAGLFSNAESLVPLYQMLLNKGKYGGRRFIKEETVKLFTQKQYGSKRALGFDRPDYKNRKQSCSKKASKQSYGHTGFTGTMVWVDPKDDLVFIFLSNRIYPSPRNWKLNKLKIRNKIHDVIYKALNTFDNNLPNWDRLINKKRLDLINKRHHKNKNFDAAPHAEFVTKTDITNFRVVY